MQLNLGTQDAGLPGAYVAQSFLYDNPKRARTLHEFIAGTRFSPQSRKERKEEALSSSAGVAGFVPVFMSLSPFHESMPGTCSSPQSRQERTEGA
jgi:hypothetical protein